METIDSHDLSCVHNPYWFACEWCGDLDALVRECRADNYTAARDHAEGLRRDSRISRESFLEQMRLFSMSEPDENGTPE